MDTTLASRLKEAMDATGVDVAALVRETGLSRAGIYFILDGTTKAEKVRDSTIAKLTKALGVNRDWLLTGRGRMAEFHGVRDDSGPVYGASQPERIDPRKVVITTQALKIVLARRGSTLDLEDPIDAELFAEAYAEAVAMQGGPGDEMALGAVVADLVAKREAMRDERDGSTGTGQPAGGADRGKARKAGAGG